MDMTNDSDYELEYSEDSTSETDVNLENQYYFAKSLKEENMRSSVDAFQYVLDLQGSTKCIWGFKALKQMVKIFFQLGQYKETMSKYLELLTYVNTAVTKNHAEKSINSILDFTSNSDDMELLKNFYETTLNVLKKSKNNRLWFKTNTKLGKVFLEKGEFNKLSGIIKQLKQACGCESESDLHKDTQLLEVYALEIQMFTELKNYQQLKDLYDKSLRVRSAIPHPLIMSVIRECGGKMYLRSGDYEKAYTDFFEAFKNYDEAGNLRRINCLKYLLLTSMLMDSAIDPFDSQEAKPYRNKPEINTMTQLITAYQSNNMMEFERLYQINKEFLEKDQLIQEHILNLLKNFRLRILLLLIKPYKAIKLEFIASELGISEDETENLLVNSILDGIVPGRIDQINKILVMNSTRQPSIYKAMELLSDRINHLSLCFDD